MTNLALDSSTAAPWKVGLVVAAAPLLIFGWDMGMALTVQRHCPVIARDELELYLIVKASFLLPLCLLLWATGNWRRCGLRGGIGLRYWPAMLPAWIAAAIAAMQLTPNIPVEQAAGWLAVGLAVAIGEEIVFRGIVFDTLAPHGTRLAVIASALLFGVAHLIGIEAGKDWHMVLAQAGFATGLGLCFGWIRAATGSLWPGIIAHTAMDGIGLAAADGVNGAMSYASDSFYGVATMAGFSLVWGALVVARPVPVRTQEEFRLTGAIIPSKPAIHPEDPAETRGRQNSDALHGGGAAAAPVLHQSNPLPDRAR